MPSLSGRHDDLPLLNQDQAAEALAVPPRTLERWRYQGGGPPFVRVGRHVRYRLRDLCQWLDDRTFRSTAEAERSH
ncbi:MAG TPA: helix-turn-helix domain-containing protein [Thermoanaerobaculia bacterium]|nr:helix-turn-helix domain-containing protein [Thermoanaerobaculia bacterium]